MNNEDILVEDGDKIRRITINRPRRRNALTPDTVTALQHAVEEAPRHGARAIVLSGAGGHFCAGADAGAALAVVEDPDPAAAHELLSVFHGLVKAIWSSDLPVIAAVSGVAYGGGFNLALLCDLIYASSDARFCQVFLRRGLVPDLGGAYLLPRLVGMQRAKQLIMLTEEIPASTAHELGLVNEVLPDAGAALSRALEVAARLTDGPSLALALSKRLLNASGGASFESALKLEAVMQADLLRTPGARDGFGGFLKRD